MSSGKGMNWEQDNFLTVIWHCRDGKTRERCERTHKCLSQNRLVIKSSFTKPLIYLHLWLFQSKTLPHGPRCGRAQPSLTCRRQDAATEPSTLPPAQRCFCSQLPLRCQPQCSLPSTAQYQPPAPPLQHRTLPSLRLFNMINERTGS